LLRDQRMPRSSISCAGGAIDHPVHPGFYRFASSEIYRIRIRTAGDAALSQPVRQSRLVAGRSRSLARARNEISRHAFLHVRLLGAEDVSASVSARPVAASRGHLTQGLSVVMPALVSASWVYPTCDFVFRVEAGQARLRWHPRLYGAVTEDVDGRDKPGHDVD